MCFNRAKDYSRTNQAEETRASGFGGLGSAAGTAAQESLAVDLSDCTVRKDQSFRAWGSGALGFV